MTGHLLKAGPLLALLLLLLPDLAQGQCVRMHDPRNGNILTTRPSKVVRCLGSTTPVNYTHSITLSPAVNNLRVIWGDGNTQTLTGSTTTISHTYTTTGTFFYSLFAPGCPDTVRGTVVNDYNLTVPGIGFITPPAGFTNKRCVPEALTINNASPNMNGFTQFVINWGDNQTDTIESDSYLRNISHTYMPATTGCNVRINIRYRNLCGATPGGLAPSATYGEYYFMDRDSARVDPAEIILCAPTDVRINDVSKLNCLDSLNRTIRWERVQGLSGPLPFPGNGVWRAYNLAGARSQLIPAALFSPIPADSTYRIKMVIRNQCGPDSAFARIRIVAPREPMLSVVNDDVCPGEAMNFRNTTADPFNAQTYEWNWGDGQVETTTNRFPSHTYAVGGTYTVRLAVIVRGFGGQVCRREKTIQVRVKRTVTAAFTVSPTQACDTLVTTIRNRSLNLTNVIWKGWSLGFTPTIQGGAGVIPTSSTNPAMVQILSTNMADSSAVVRFNSHGRYSITLRAETAGCPEQSVTNRVFIYPSPAIRWRASTRSVCMGSGVTFFDSSRVISTEQRALPNDWNHLSWRLTMGDGTVYNSNGTVTGNFNSPGNSGRITSHTYSAPGQYWVRLRVSTPYACVRQDSMLITVRPNVAPSFSVRPDRCDPSRVMLINRSSVDTARYVFTIRRGGAPYRQIVQTVRDSVEVILPYVGPGDSTFYQISLRGRTGSGGDTCAAQTAQQVVKVPPTPVASFNASVSDGCTPLQDVQFFSNSYGLGGSTGYTYQWSFGNGQSHTGETPPLQTYVNPGNSNRRDTVRLTLISSNGCRFGTQREIITYPAPQAQIVAPTDVCHGQTVGFRATGTGITQYLWQFTDLDGTASALANPTKVVSNTGPIATTHTIDLTVRTTAGCTGTAQHTLRVHPAPGAAFTIAPDEVCGNAATPITVTAQPGSALATRYFWNFGDGQPSTQDSMSSVATHSYLPNASPSAVSYTITLTTASAFGCRSLPARRPVTILPAVRALFVADTNRVCAPGQVTFANVGFRAGVTYQWHIKTATAPGVGTPLGVNLPNGGLRHTFINPANEPELRYVITLTASAAGASQCADTLRDTITVLGVPTAAFNIAGLSPASGCSPLTVTLAPTADPVAIRYEWDFGQGNPPTLRPGPTQIAHTYVATASQDRDYLIQLRVVSAAGCQATATRSVRVRPRPQAAFTLDRTSGCQPLTVRATNLSSPSSDNFTWLVDGQPYAFERTPAAFRFESRSATAPTVYTIRLVARGVGNACVDTSAPQTVTVAPAPMPRLSATPASGCSPLQVRLSGDSTLGASQYRWAIRRGDTGPYTALPAWTGSNHDTTLINTGSADQNWHVRLVALNGMGCRDSVTTVVNVSPRIAASMTVLPDTIGCAPLALTLRNTTSSPSANVFSWRVDGIERSTNPIEFGYVFTNSSATADQIYTVSMTASSGGGGCPSTVTRRIRVKPVPTVGFGTALLPTTACSPVRVSLTPTGVAGAARLRWTLGAGDTLTTTRDTALTRTFVNNGVIPMPRQIRLEAISTFGCRAQAERTVTVNPRVVAAMQHTPLRGCSPHAVAFTSASSVGADVLEWYVGGQLRGSGQQHGHTFVNNGTRPDTVIVRLVARNSLASVCQDVTEVRVIVLPKPAMLSFVASPPQGCSPLSTQLTATAARANRFTYDFGDGIQVDTTAQSLVHTYSHLSPVGSRTFLARIIGRNDFGCSDSMSAPVTVRPGSRAVISTADTVGCSPLRIRLTGASSVNANLYEWDFGPGQMPSYQASPVVTYTNSTDQPILYTLRLIASRGGNDCPDTTYQVVRVLPVPRAQVSPGDTMGCQPLAVGLRDRSMGGLTNRWTIESVNGQETLINRSAIDTVLGNSSSSILRVNVLLEVANGFGCTSQAQTALRVGPLVQASFVSDNDSVCTPVRVRFTNTSTMGTRALWLIDGTPASSLTPGFAQTFTNSGDRDITYRVTLISHNPSAPACLDTAYGSVTVFPRPQAGQLFAAPQQGCSPLLVELNGSATGATRYEWDLRDGTRLDTSSQTISHTFINNSLSATQTFMVRQVAISERGCRDTTQIPVSVRPGVMAAFTVSDTAGCSPLTVQFSGAPSVNANTFTWDFGDQLSGSTVRNPVHRFFNRTDTVQTYTVTLTADRTGVGCPSNATRTIRVYPLPIAAMTPGDTGGCQPLRVSFRSLSTGADSLVWRFTSPLGLTEVPNRPIYDTSLTNPTTSLLVTLARLSAFNTYGCSSHTESRITTAPFTQAGFELNIDSGCAPLRVVATNTSAPGANLQWFINRTPQMATGNQLVANLINTGDRDTVYTIKLVAANRLAPGCSDTIRRTVRVFARPVAGPLFASPAQGCSPLLSELNGSATGAVRYEWDMGDGTRFDTVSQTVSHTFINFSLLTSRTFRVRQVAVSQHGCRDTATTTLVVRPNVTAGISAPVTQGCSPLGVQLSSAASVNANLYTWDFGDGTAGSTAAEPYHVFINSSDTIRRFQVTLIADRLGIGCPAIDTRTITVFPTPVARVIPGDTGGCQPMPVSLRSASLGASSLFWMMISPTGQVLTFVGRPQIDTILTHNDPAIQASLVRLTVANTFGCRDSVQHRVQVNPVVAARMTPSHLMGCTPLQVDFTSQAAQGNRIEWYVDGQLISRSDQSLRYTFLNPYVRDTTYTVMMVAQSRYDAACSDTARETITVFGRPSAGLLHASPEQGCSPLLVELNGDAVGGQQYEWHFGDGTRLDTTSQTVSHTFVNPDPNRDRTFRVRFVAITGRGCRDSATADISVRPGVRAGFAMSDTAGCAPLGVQFTNASANANLYEWDFGDGLGVSYQTNPYRVFQNDSDTVRTLTIALVADKNGVGCPAVYQRRLTLYPRPVARFTPADTAGCQPFALRFTSASERADRFRWTLSGTGGQTVINDRMHFDSVFANPTSQALLTSVQLEVESRYGCRAQVTRQVRTYPLVAAAMQPDRDSGCSPLRVRFDNLSATANRVTWYVGSDYAGNDPHALRYTFINQGDRDSVYTVTLVAEHPGAPGCADTLRRRIKVFAKPVAGPLYATPEQGCSPLSSQLELQTLGTYRYEWDLADGTRYDTTASSLPHTFTNPTLADRTFLVRVRMISAQGCSDTAQRLIRVKPEVQARIALLNPEGCTPHTAVISGAGSLLANRFEWDFGDGAVSIGQADVQHRYVNATDTTQAYRVRLIADRAGVGCPDTASVMVQVHPRPRTELIIPLAEGCSPVRITARDSSIGIGLNRIWTMSDGTRLDTMRARNGGIDTLLTNTGGQRRTALLGLTVVSQHGCRASVSQPVAINPLIVARFERPAPGCAPWPVRFRNASINPDDVYEWDFGDGSRGSTEKHPIHTFRYTGSRDTVYVIRMTARSGPGVQPVCESVFIDSIRVGGRPDADFALLPDNVLRLPNNTLQVQNLTRNRALNSYQWSFGDGSTDTTREARFSRVLTGLNLALLDTSLTVRLIVTAPSGCQDTTRQLVRILPIKPVADFGPDTQGCAPLDVVFQNRSRWANQYLWTFGDGTSSTEQNPAKRYSRPGVYTVRLFVRGPGGADTIVREDIIEVFDVPDAKFTTFPRAPRKIRIPDDELIGLVRNPSPGNQYFWTFGDGGTSTEQEPRHLYRSVGTYRITLRVTTPNGCVAHDTLQSGAIVDLGGDLLIPNAFSPNPSGSNGGLVDGGEGYNDVFYPVTEGVKAIKLQIYDRWGTMIYQSTTLNVGWDGYYKGRICPPDTYVYVIEATMVNGEIRKKVGDVTLFR